MANQLKLVVQALAEKYEVSASEVTDILEEVPSDILDGLDWSDLNSLVQEVLVDRSAGVKGEFNWGEFGGSEQALYGFHPRR